MWVRGRGVDSRDNCVDGGGVCAVSPYLILDGHAHLAVLYEVHTVCLISLSTRTKQDEL